MVGYWLLVTWSTGSHFLKEVMGKKVKLSCCICIFHLLCAQVVPLLWSSHWITDARYRVLRVIFPTHSAHRMGMNCRVSRVSARSALPLSRSTACTGRPMPASRRPRPSSPLGSCPIRPCGRPPPAPPPAPPRGPSPHRDREGPEGGWEGKKQRRSHSAC